jgi:hypothetical protein
LPGGLAPRRNQGPRRGTPEREPGARRRPRVGRPARLAAIR